MSMSAGLPTDDPWGDRQESMTRAELYALLQAGIPFVKIPGTGFEYSNLGYALLGQVIEMVTAQPFIVAVNNELLNPLELANTNFSSPSGPSADLAQGFRRSEGNWLETPLSGPGVFSPMGGLFSTPHDLAKWAGWLAGALDPEKVQTGPLSAASRREMQQVHRSIAAVPAENSNPPRGQGYGFGLFIDQDPVWGTTVHHSGGYPGFSTHMRWNYSAGVGIVGFENASYSGAKAPVTEALALALQHLTHRIKTPLPWTETLTFKEAAESLILEWNDDIADRIFANNVALDIPYTERAHLIAQAIVSVGGMRPGRAGSPQVVNGDSPAHLVWRIPGEHGNLRCEIRLAPITPAAIQTFTVTPE